MSHEEAAPETRGVTVGDRGRRRQARDAQTRGLTCARVSIIADDSTLGRETGSAATMPSRATWQRSFAGSASHRAESTAPSSRKFHLSVTCTTSGRRSASKPHLSVGLTIQRLAASVSCFVVLPPHGRPSNECISGRHPQREYAPDPGSLPSANLSGASRGPTPTRRPDAHSRARDGMWKSWSDVGRWP